MWLLFQSDWPQSFIIHTYPFHYIIMNNNNIYPLSHVALDIKRYLIISHNNHLLHNYIKTNNGNSILSWKLPHRENLKIICVGPPRFIILGIGRLD